LVIDTVPVLVVGFNRPDHLKTLLESIAVSPPKVLLCALDGPRLGNSSDELLVRDCREVVEEMNIDSEIVIRFRENNLGLRGSIVDAVDWACEKYGKVIVLEDDVQIGPNLIDFLEHGLNRYEQRDDIAHINGYNLVPSSELTDASSAFRTTRYIESYAWATWERAWRKYDDSMTWGANVSLKELSSITGGYVSAVKWKLNFADALSERIDTWAYRWMSTIWSERKIVLSPNANLVNYLGQTSGTHTRLKTRWQELPVSSDLIRLDETIVPMEIDEAADQWLKLHVFDESLLGIAKGLAASAILRFVK
jgi:hypothetical protein